MHVGDEHRVARRPPYGPLRKQHQPFAGWMDAVEGNGKVERPHLGKRYAARLLLGAYLFGGITILGLHIQAAGFEASSHLLATLPYLATILVLVAISRDATRIRLNAPAALGKPFHPDA